MVRSQPPCVVLHDRFQRFDAVGGFWPVFVYRVAMTNLEGPRIVMFGAQPLYKIISHGILTIVTSTQAKIPRITPAATGSMKAFIISGVMLTFSGFFDMFCGCVNWRRKAAVDVVGPFIAFGADHILHDNSRIHHWHWQFESKPFVAA
jgi:hypothetical protein